MDVVKHLHVQGWTDLTLVEHCCSAAQNNKSQIR